MTPYPFTALVGQADLQLSLLLNAVSPAIGGVLVRGEKGTAKSTAVRALTALLPGVDVVPGCRFSCDPAAPDPACPDGPHEGAGAAESRAARMVELPVGASEDRLVGALDIERALSEGVKAFEPGLLADAHRGVLYVDEVNLLHDHLVDLLLDAAAMGASYVEREGVSVRHASRFLLVGTMNPEEGELRPQLLDRFGLTVEVAASRETDERVEVVRRRLAYDDDPEGFAARWADDERELRQRIAAARNLLPRVRLGDAALRQIAATCAAFEVDGMRADLVMARTATALAAWAGRADVESADVRQAALLALPHRRRRNPFDAPGLDEDKLDRTLEENAGQDDDSGPEPEGPDDGGPDGGGGVPPQGAPQDEAQAPQGEPSIPGQPQPEPAEQAAPPQSPEGATGEPDPNAPAPPQQTAAPAGEPFRARTLTVPGLGEGAAGRRSRARTAHGRTTGARRPQGALGKLHLAATVQAAAPYQHARGRRGSGLLVRRDDLREAVREGREGNLVLFVVDASGSMAARQRMSAVKGAVLSLLLDAYQRRDKVGMVTFRRGEAEVALPPTSSVDAAAARLESLPTGGRTPLAAGLLRAREVLRVERLRDPARRPLLVTVTDGRATGGPEPLVRSRQAARLLAADGTASVVVDCEAGHVRLGLARELAAQLGGSAVTLDELRADAVTELVRSTTDSRNAGHAGRAA
ncbi:putative cobaltochelatase [Streptomyces sp. NPDC053499]|uniref:putative cobaltochelatase n=1 Tax=Streptomyces sp. NPDC053499 TaxID=3365707 RepID=UPI0037CD11F2